MRNTKVLFKTLEPRLHPTMQDGHCIKYFLKLKGFSLSAIGCRICVKGETVLNVVCGRRRSRRVEAEIARILGKESWDDVVIEARLAVSDPAYPPSAVGVLRSIWILKCFEV